MSFPLTPFVRGIVVPIVTPLSAPDALDCDALRRLVDFVIEGGVNAIFALGTTGEGPALSPAVQEETVRLTVSAAGKRVPVLAGVSSSSGAESLRLAVASAEAGADAVVSALPCYFPTETDDEVVRFFTVLADRSPLPVFVYDMPAMVKVKISYAALSRLARHPNIIGYKDSSGDLESLRAALRVKADRPGFSVLIGPEHLTKAALELGGDGGVNGGANLRPELFMGLYQAFLAGNAAALAEAQREIEAFQPVYGSPVTAGSCIRGLKKALAARGLIQDITAFPAMP